MTQEKAREQFEDWFMQEFGVDRDGVWKSCSAGGAEFKAFAAGVAAREDEISALTDELTKLYEQATEHVKTIALAREIIKNFVDEAREWTVEQTQDERILCVWYELNGIRLKREVAVLCNWNSKDDQERDEAFLLQSVKSASLGVKKYGCFEGAKSVECRNPLHACTDGSPVEHEIGSSCMAEER